MFSSLEALDAEDNLNSTPVVRQGAFQPKAKPRVRKGAAAPARTSTSAPAPKTKNVIDQPQRDKVNAPKLQGEAKVLEAVQKMEITQQHLLSQSLLVGTNFDDPSVDVAPEVFMQVGAETGPMQNLGLTGTSPIRTAGFRESVGCLSFDVDAAVECEANRTLTEPTTLDTIAEVSKSPGKVILSTQESVAYTSEIVSEPNEISPSSAFFQGRGLGAGESHTSTASKGLLASCAFESLQSCTQGHASMKEKDSSLEPLSEEFQIHGLRDVAVPSMSSIQSDVPEPVAPLEEIDHINASGFATQINDGQAVEGVADTGVFCQQGVTGLEDPSSYQMTEIDGALRKEKSTRKDRRDNLLVMNQHNQVPDKEASSFERATNSKSKTKPVKKKRKGASDNPAVAISAGEVVVAEEFAQVVVVNKSAAEPAKKKMPGSKRAQKRGHDGQSTSMEASSQKSKNTTSASASQSGAGIAVDVSRAKGPAKTSVMKQEAQSQVEEQQDVGEAYTSGVSKRKKRKPAKFLDSADDDEAIISSSSIKGSLKPAKRSRKHESQVHRKREDAFENELLCDLFPSLPEKISKLKASHIASSRAITNATASESSAKAGLKSKSKPVTPTSEESQKKSFKKCVQQKRKVDRRAINPADPDLDPKKMTMKDIIRLAEAKERMLKKDNAKKAKNGNQVLQSEPEREQGNYESTCLAPQVQIIDGKIVINEQSLVINAHPKDDIRTYRRVEETHAKLNYHSYMKRTPIQVWRHDETELFYKALREFGTNFAMIQHLFPGRTRKQVLLKFKKEERRSPLRISEAMRVKPCENSHFLEVMSSLNLLPSQVPDEDESGQASVPLELSPSRKDMGDISGTSGGGEKPMAGNGECALKLDELSIDSEKNNEISKIPFNTEAFTSGQPVEDEELHVVKPPEVNEVVKPCESPTKALPLPCKKKSLFSYQTAAAKS